MKRRTSRYELQSLDSAVEAVSSITIGDSMRSASGNTTPPYAARLTVGSGSRAIMALTAGSSSPIMSQLAASGHQLENTARTATGGDAGGAAMASSRPVHEITL